MNNQQSAPLRALDNPFLFSSHEVRAATDDKGEAWFCAKDVYKALGIKWSGVGTSLRNYPQNWFCHLFLRGLSGSGEVVFISEPAVYRVLFRSNKPQAEQFANWVCEEVLPSIRRLGYYGSITASQQIQLRAQKIKLLEALTASDAFIYQSVLTSLHDVCNQLGESMPNIRLLGQDRHQIDMLGDKP